MPILDFFTKAAQLILSLSILVTLHELGHFLPAKLFKTRVEKFFLFFDVKFSLFKKKIGDTVYGIGWLPLGGYVKIAGMVDESMDKEQLKKPPQPWEFRAKPAWQRLVIMSGGVIVNFFLGFFIFILLVYTNGKKVVSNSDLTHGLVFHQLFQDIGFKNGDKILSIDNAPIENINMLNSKFFLHDPKSCVVLNRYGETHTISIPDNIGDLMWEKGVSKAMGPRFKTVVDSVIGNSPAQQAGIQKGDQVLSIEGSSAEYWDEFTAQVKNYKNQLFKVVLKRGDKLREVSLSTDEKGLVGVFLDADQLETTTLTYSFFESISAGFDLGKEVLVDYIAQFKYLFTSKGVEQIGGIGAMGKMFPSSWNWELFWSNTAFISIMLAFLNILPIPALDGGHILFVIWEMIFRRKPSDKFLEYAQITGFIILMSLFFYANGNDVYKTIFNY